MTPDRPQRRSPRGPLAPALPPTAARWLAPLQLLLLLVAGGPWCTLSVTAQGVSPPLSPATLQALEKNALLQLRDAMNNHPAFAGFTPDPTNTQQQGLPYRPWMDGPNPDVPGPYLPCVAAWAWVECNIQSQVVAINLNGGVLGKVNLSWSAPGGDPLTGPIPWAQMGALSSLANFDISLQYATGGLAGVEALPSLQFLAVSFNHIEGEVPRSISKLTRLTSLRANDNRLSGPLPASLWASTRLSFVDVSSNYLNGTAPKEPARPVTLDDAYNCMRGTDQRPAAECAAFYKALAQGPAIAPAARVPAKAPAAAPEATTPSAAAAAPAKPPSAAPVTGVLLPPPSSGHPRWQQGTSGLHALTALALLLLALV